jgi:hypothetical protein
MRTHLTVVGSLVILGACSSPPSVTSVARPEALPTLSPGRVYFGPAIVNAGPTIELCPDGTYTKSQAFPASPSSGSSVKDGLACCTNRERGRYSVTLDARGEPTKVRFLPEQGPGYESEISAESLEGFHRGPRPPTCRADGG